MVESLSGPALVAAIHSGDVTLLQELLDANPGLASPPLGGPFKTRTPLHVAADWPGYFPNAPQVVQILIAAGADPNARHPGDETPLHWAASSDDVDVAGALIDGGADIEVPDGSIGTPLDNAVGYACWHVARLLVARGAVVDKLWHAAALGLMDRLAELFDKRQDVTRGALPSLLARLRRGPAPGSGVPAWPRGRPELGPRLCQRDPARCS